jgi:Mce-associated membrane protein
VPATPELASAVPAPDTVAMGLSGAGSATTELAPDQVLPPRGYDGGMRGRGVVGLVVGLVAIVLLVAGALAAWFGPVKGGREEQRLADRRQEAVNRARELALNIGTLNYARLDDDLRKIAESTTGKARAEFDEKILKNEAYKKLVRDNQAELRTTIVRIGLEPCGDRDEACLRGDTAVALVFLDQESKNKLRPTPRVDRNRVALTLVRDGDGWLISEVQVL